MSARHDRSEKAEKEFVKELKARGWKKREIDAALGGWEWVLDNTCSDDPDFYDIKKLSYTDGSCEAMDMADAAVEDGGWKKSQREAVADIIYEGITAAMKFVEGDKPAQ